MSYHLAPSLVKLRNQVNDGWPRRSKKSDGWIGDASHRARKSDHNPDYSDGGVVRALDITNLPSKKATAELVENLIRDPRTEYVIHDHKIWSRSHGFKPRRYTGSNPHTGHVHVSIRHTDGAEHRLGNWLNNVEEDRGDASTPHAGIWLDNVREEATAAERQPTASVKRVQRLLKGKGLYEGRRDGLFGPKTRRAYAKWQRRLGYVGDDADGIPGESSLRRLAAGSSFKVHA